VGQEVEIRFDWKPLLWPGRPSLSQDRTKS
jgi:hypothetical protein